MNFDLILANLPVLLIAVPLFGAFITPVFGRFLPIVRDAWVILASFVSSVIAILLALAVYAKGVIVYVFGAAPGTGAIPADSGGIPIRIIFTIDGFGAFMLISATIVSFAVILYLTVSPE